MLWFIGISTFWFFGSALAVALCVMARRGDEVQAALLVAAVAELPAEVPWVATLAAPPEVPAPARASQAAPARA